MVLFLESHPLPFTATQKSSNKLNDWEGDNKGSCTFSRPEQDGRKSLVSKSKETRGIMNLCVVHHHSGQDATSYQSAQTAFIPLFLPHFQ